MKRIALILLLSCSWATGATLTVGTDKTYQTIQAAIDAVTGNDTIAVDAGDYAESLTFAATCSNRTVTVNATGARLVPELSAATALTVSATAPTLTITGLGVVPTGTGTQTLDVQSANGAITFSGCAVDTTAITAANMPFVFAGTQADGARVVTLSNCTVSTNSVALRWRGGGSLVISGGTWARANTSGLNMSFECVNSNTAVTLRGVTITGGTAGISIVEHATNGHGLFEIDDCTFSGSTTANISVSPVTNPVTFTRLWIHDCRFTGVRSATFGKNTGSIWFEDNVVVGTGDAGDLIAIGGNNGDAAVTGIYLLDNDFRVDATATGSWHGVNCKHNAAGGRFIGNRVYVPTGYGLVNKGEGIEIAYNKVRGANCLWISGETKNNYWHHNTVYATDGVGLQFYYDAAVGRPTFNVVENNIIHAADGADYALHEELSDATAMGHNRVDHNLYFAEGSAKLADFNSLGAGSQEKTTLAAIQAAWPTGCWGGANDDNSIVANPLLRGPSTGNFVLSTVSPAIGAGYPRFTFNGTTYGPTIGAWQPPAFRRVQQIQY